MVSLWLICTLISNVWDYQVAYNNYQMAIIQDMQTGQVSESKAQGTDVAGTGISTTGVIPLDAIRAVFKSFTMEYSFLYDLRTGMTRTTCEALGNGKWQSATSTCKVPNDWYLPFLLIMWGPIAIGLIYFLIYLVRG
jgi:hypothetical protein